jgi:hypothetical protein
MAENFSKLAIAMAAPSADSDDNSNWDAVSWCDMKLQEVRDVLGLLQNLPRQTPPCFCRVKWEEGHDGICSRARALLERTEKNVNDEQA